MTPDELAARLDRGWEVCNKAPPRDRRRYEEHWLSLLDEYESAYMAKNPECVALFEAERHCDATTGAPVTHRTRKDTTCQHPSPSPDASQGTQSSRMQATLDLPS